VLSLWVILASGVCADIVFEERMVLELPVPLFRTLSKLGFHNKPCLMVPPCVANQLLTTKDDKAQRDGLNPHHQASQGLAEQAMQVQAVGCNGRRVWRGELGRVRVGVLVGVQHCHEHGVRLLPEF
jgi:hypothetical protein